VTETAPETGPAFEAMMREIDAEFVRDGLPIPSRSLHAVMAVGKRFKIGMPLVPPPSGAPPELMRYAQLSKNIHEWYELVYGDRTKIDFSPGKMVLTIDGDLYLLSLPRIYGAVHFFAVRQFLEHKFPVTRGPAGCNILQLIESLTPAKAATFSDQTLDYITRSFKLALEAHDLLEASQGHSLIQIARGDIQTAVNNLMDRGDRFGESKWASLQAAEKILKATIEFEGAKFRFGHELMSFCEQLDDLGITCDWAPLISKIQCRAGIRYGEMTCTREEAVEAHQASLGLVAALKGAGAKFKRRLG
jgi:HEPN domain